MEQIFNSKKNKVVRRVLRKNMTEYEKILWNKIRRDFLGVRFRRQYGIGNYIADFYCPEFKIVIEIDGGQHFEDEGLEYDRVRENDMKNLGIKTLRFTNIDILKNIDGVLEQIKIEIDDLVPPLL